MLLLKEPRQICSALYKIIFRELPWSSKNDDDEFEADPLLPHLLNGTQDEIFCLGMVANWPPPTSSMRTEYEIFLSRVKKLDLFETDSFYLMPFHSLHITVATMYPAARVEDMKRRNISTLQVQAKWKEIALKASNLPEWPKKPFTLQMKTAQIGSRAGIFLWEEISGGLATVRSCLTQVVQEESASGETEGGLPAWIEDLRIPDIVHSTFLRYSKRPTKGTPQSIHDQLQESVRVQDIFTKPVEVDSIQLINCKVYLQDVEDAATLHISLDPSQKT